MRYELWVWWDSDIGWQRLDDGNLSSLTYTHAGVTAGVTYYYAIRAVNAAGETSDWSDYVPATVPAALSVPALTAKAVEDAIELSWGAVDGATRYDLWVWRDSDVGWQRLDDGNLSSLTYTHAGVTAGVTYYYTIRAVNAAGETSGWQKDPWPSASVPD